MAREWSVITGKIRDEKHDTNIDDGDDSVLRTNGKLRGQVTRKMVMTIMKILVDNDDDRDMTDHKYKIQTPFLQPILTKHWPRKFDFKSVFNSA